MTAEYSGGIAVFRKPWLVAGVAAVIAAAGLGLGVVIGQATDDGDASKTNAGQQGGVPTLGTELRQPIHEHADLALFINGERFDFGQDRFISDEQGELSPNVHVHHPRHTVVHVHREGTTWDEFFLSVGFELSDATNFGERGKETLKLANGEVLKAGEGGSFTFIVNDVKVDGIADLNISALDRVLISFGNEDEAGIQAQWAQVSDEACIPQGVCLDRGNGNGEHGEPEPCSGAGQCTG